MKRAGRSVSFLFIERLIRLSVGLILLGMIARYFGPDAFGKFTYIISITGFFLVFANAGTSEVLTDFIISDNSRKYEYFVASLLLRSFASLIAVLICYITFTYSILDDPDFLFAAKLSLLLFICPPIEVFTQYHSYKENFKTISFARFFGFLSDSFVKLITINYQLGLSILVLSKVAELFVTSLYLCTVKTVHNVKIILSPRMLWCAFRKITWRSAPLLLVSLLSYMLIKMDIIMVSQLMDFNSVGHYGISARIFEIILLFPGLLVFSVRPALLKVNLSSSRKFKHELIKVMSFLFYSSCIIVFLVIVFGRYAIEFIFGLSFSESYLPMVILSTGCIFVSTTLPLTIWQINKGFGHYRLVSQIVALTFNFALNLTLIPKFGLVGAAIATSSSFVLAFVVSMILFTKQREMLRMLIKCIRYKFFKRSLILIFPARMFD